jgi:hypothetical protein
LRNGEFRQIEVRAGQEGFTITQSRAGYYAK